MRIVLVEDNPGDVYLVRYALQSRGLECSLTNYGDAPQAIDAVPQLEQDPPDAFLIDLSLPRGDGFSVLEEIRKSALLRQTPVAILSSSVSPADKEMAACFQAQFVSKPSNLDDFAEVVGAAIVRLLEPAKRSATKI